MYVQDRGELKRDHTPPDNYLKTHRFKAVPWARDFLSFFHFSFYLEECRAHTHIIYMTQPNQNPSHVLLVVNLQFEFPLTIQT